MKHSLASAAAPSAFTDAAGALPGRERLVAECRRAESDESARIAESALGPAGS